MVGRSDLKAVEKKIGLFRKRVEEKGVVGAKYLLFGSWAKGNVHKYSDIDLCVVSDKFSGDTFADSTFLRLMTIGIDSLLEPVAMRPEDLEDKYNTLAQEIKKTGIRVI